MSVFHFHKPREREYREALVDYLIDKIDDNYFDEFLRLLDRYRQAIFNHGVAAEREQKEGYKNNAD